MGGSSALMVPISGMVIWKSDSTSSRIGLERLIGPVELVDQQDGRQARNGLRLQCSAEAAA